MQTGTHPWTHSHNLCCGPHFQHLRPWLSPHLLLIIIVIFCDKRTRNSRTSPLNMFCSQGLGNNQLSKHSPSDLHVNCFVWGDFFSVVYLCNKNWICLKSQEASADFDRVQYLKYSCSSITLHPVSAPRSSAHLYHKRLRERDQAWTLTFGACSTVQAQVSEDCAEIT